MFIVQKVLFKFNHRAGVDIKPPSCIACIVEYFPVRNYFVDMPVTERPGQMEPQQGQTAERQLDGFDDVADIFQNKDTELFQQKNGYLTADEKQLDKFLKRFVCRFEIGEFGFK